MRRPSGEMAWRELMWQRPLNFALVLETITHLATVSRQRNIAFELRASGGKVRYLVGAYVQDIHKVEVVLTSREQTVISKLRQPRKPLGSAKQVKLSQPQLALNTDQAEAVARAVLAGLAQVGKQETVVLQVMLGSTVSPRTLPEKVAQSNSGWLAHLWQDAKAASSDHRTAMREKRSYHGLNALVRVGAISGDPRREQHLLAVVVSALKTMESAGCHLFTKPEKAANLTLPSVPYHRVQCFSVKEIACLIAAPLGEITLPAVGGIHPKHLPSPDWLKPAEAGWRRTFGQTADLHQMELTIAPIDSLRHTILLGPTGAGKSTAMLALIMADITAGRGALVIDPKADLISDVLRRIPEHRLTDVVVLDPSDHKPVGFNPLAPVAGQSPNLVADTVLSVMKEIFSDSWGVRTQDILTAALLTLVQTPRANLVWLPSLLTDDAFRQSITRNIKNNFALTAFWQQFEAMKPAERNQAIGPVLNKLRQFMLRPELRGMLGQSQPKFSLTDLFNKRKIVLVPLNKGIVGAENARLLGSLIVGMAWTLSLGRAKLPPSRRPITSIFIDELQEYLKLPTSLSDALAEARGMGVGLTMAHQYRGQLSPDMRAAIDANARNKIIFGLNAEDAKQMATQAPELKWEDFAALPRFAVYANLMRDGRQTGWLSATTVPPMPERQNAAEVKAQSQARYGCDLAQVDAECLAHFGQASLRHSEDSEVVIGRKPRNPSATQTSNLQTRKEGSNEDI